MKNLGRYDDDLSVPRKKDVPAASTTAPKAPGIAAPGESKLYSRSDHVHPSEVFIATYGTTTYNEIRTAYRAGKIVICARSTGLDSTDYYFYELSAQALPGLGDPYIQFSLGKYYVRVTTNNVWSNGVHNPTINGKTLTDTTNLELGSTTNATLSSSDWATSGAWKTQTVSVTGLKASYNAAPFVDVALSGTDAAADAELAAAWLGISASAIANTAANSLTVKFPATVDTPTVNIPIRVTTYD